MRTDRRPLTDLWHHFFNTRTLIHQQNLKGARSATWSYYSILIFVFFSSFWSFWCLVFFGKLKFVAYGSVKSVTFTSVKPNVQNNLFVFLDFVLVWHKSKSKIGNQSYPFIYTKIKTYYDSFIFHIQTNFNNI